MKINSNRDVLDISLGSTENTQQFSIANTPEFYQLLSDNLYASPKLAVIRETLTNAHDANIENNLEDEPIVVEYKDNILSIKDNGKGINPNKIQEIYCTYGLSTKTDTELTGGFGLGCKTPFALVDSFIVENNFENKCYIYLMKKTNDVPSVTLLGVKNTDTSGVKVVIDLKKRRINDSFDVLNLKDIYTSMGVACNIPIIFNNEILSKKYHYDSDNILFLNIDIYVSNIVSNFNRDDIFLRYGNNILPCSRTKLLTEASNFNLNRNEFRKFASFFDSVSNIITGIFRNYLICMPPNSIDLIPSREGIRYTEHSVSSILKQFKFVNQYIEKSKIEFKHKASYLLNQYDKNDISSALNKFNNWAYSYGKSLDLLKKPVSTLQDLKLFLCFNDTDFIKEFYDIAKNNAICYDKEFNDKFYSNVPFSMENTDNVIFDDVINNYILKFIPEKITYKLLFMDNYCINNKIRNVLKNNTLETFSINELAMVPFITIVITPYISNTNLNDLMEMAGCNNETIFAILHIRSITKAKKCYESFKNAGKKVVNLFDYAEKRQVKRKIRVYKRIPENSIYYDFNWACILSGCNTQNINLLDNIYQCLDGDFLASHTDKQILNTICNGKTLVFVDNKVELKRAIKNNIPSAQDIIFNYLKQYCQKNKDFRNIVKIMMYLPESYRFSANSLKNIILFALNTPFIKKRYNWDINLTEDDLKMILLSNNLLCCKLRSVYTQFIEDELHDCDFADKMIKDKFELLGHDECFRSLIGCAKAYIKHIIKNNKSINNKSIDNNKEIVTILDFIFNHEGD